MSTGEQNTDLAKKMSQQVALFEASKLTPREYCQGKDYTIHKFNYWRYKMQKEKRSKPGVSGGFTRVELAAASVADSMTPTCSAIPSLEVSLSNGNRLVFYQDFSKELLKIFL